ncbi:hypothetical protein V6N11_042058 [Hibiscus sabdariffa]|uniref:DUF4283 domain-containing protein n=1 Tax=Hibiscus sabdariffa TaxID=183260 RepID=A0ABR2QVB2_9ROSI
MMENPSALVNPSLHGYDHSGSRPPDKLAQIGEPPVLETDGVAVETLDPCTPKKLKNSDDVVDGNLKSSAILENGLSTDSAMRRLGYRRAVRSVMVRYFIIFILYGGDLQLIDLENNYFLVQIEDECDYTTVFTEGPWIIYGNYLMVQLWSRTFSTMEKHPSRVIVWIRLPGLPYPYYCKALFRLLVDLYVWTIIRRLANAKPEYEGLQQICFHCGLYGHAKESCGKLAASGSDVRRDESAQAKADRTTKLYGSWMLVTNNRRRNLSSKAGSKGARTGGAVNEGSRFAILNDDVMEEGLPVGQTEGVVAMDMGGDEGQHVKKDVVSSSKGMLSTHNIVKNAAYLTSNLNKRAKNGGSVANRVMEVDIPCGWDSTRTCVTKGDEWRWESYSGFYWG